MSTNTLEGEFSITTSLYTSCSRRIITIIRPAFTGWVSVKLLSVGLKRKNRKQQKHTYTAEKKVTLSKLLLTSEL